MANTRKQNALAGMGKARAGRCQACAHEGHAQAGAWRTQARKKYAHTKGFAGTRICQDKQAGKRANEDKVHAGRCKVGARRKDMQCKHLGKTPDVSLSLSLGITCHQRDTTRDNGGKWPYQAHCCEQ